MSVTCVREPRAGRFPRSVVAAAFCTLALGVGFAPGEPSRPITPDEQDVTRELQTIRSALRVQYERAEDDRDFRPLITSLQKMAGVSDRSVRKYALMMEAERLALEDRLYGIALQSAEERASVFGTSIWQERRRIVDSMADSPILDHTEEAIMLADYFLRLALSREEFAEAAAFRDRLSALVDEYGKREKAREEELRKAFSGAVEKLKRDPRRKIRSSWDLVKQYFPHRRKDRYAACLREAELELRDAEARAKTRRTGEPPATGESADDLAGQRLCFDRYSWPEGIAKLASGRGLIAEAAKKELAAGSNPSDEERIALADEWWRAGEELLERENPNLSDVASLRTHASELYLQSMSKVGDTLVEAVGKDRVQATDPPRIIVDVGRATANTTSADEAIVSYEMYLARPDLDESSRRAAEVQLQRWKFRATAKAMRHGDQWLPAELRQKAMEEAADRISYGIKLLEDGKTDLAEVEFKAASELDPSSPIAESVLGWLYFWLKGRDFFWTGHELLATEFYREASRRDPSNGVVLTNLANCELITGRHLDAAVHYERAVDNLPDPIVANNIGWAVKNSRPLGLSADNLRQFNDLYRRAVTDLDIGETDNDRLVFFKPFVEPIKSGTNEAKDRSDTTPKIVGAGSGTGFVVAPGYVVTNYHVVEGATDITITDMATPSKRHPATIVATARGHANGQDLALLRCEGLAHNTGIPLAEHVAARGEDVMALGFPCTDVLGKALKATRGAVVSAVDESGLFFLDCTINPGNSGGPIVDDRGRVIGAVVAITKRELLVGNSYSLGIPVEAIRAFLEKHLPDAAKAHVADRAAKFSKESLKWKDVDAQVSASTMFIQMIIRQGADKASKSQTDSDAAPPSNDSPQPPAEESTPTAEAPAAAE
jgi:S1-C subfamily serine protease